MTVARLNCVLLQHIIYITKKQFTIFNKMEGIILQIYRTIKMYPMIKKAKSCYTWRVKKVLLKRLSFHASKLKASEGEAGKVSHSL